MKFWNEDGTPSPAIDISDFEKYMSQETVTGAGNLGQIEDETAPEENAITLAEDGGTPRLYNGNKTQGNAENMDQEDRAVTHEMASHLGLPCPETLDLRGGNDSENWKKFKQKKTNYEIATGVNTRESATRVAKLLTVIGNDAIDVFNTLTWDTEGDDKKIDKVLEKLEEDCEPKKNVTSFQQRKKVAKPLINMILC